MPESFESLEARLHDLGGFIRDQRRNARLSLRKLSELAGISNPYLSQIERGLRKPSAEILQSIARGLRISAETLYVRAGILDERGGDGSSADPVGAIGDGGGMNVYVRGLATGLARAGVECDVYRRAEDRLQPSVVQVEPGFRVLHVEAGPRAVVPKHDLPALVDPFVEASMRRIAAS